MYNYCRPTYVCQSKGTNSHVYAAHYEQNADTYWDTFYKRNDDRFFSDRHYLQHEFPELISGPITLLEVSCLPLEQCTSPLMQKTLETDGPG